MWECRLEMKKVLGREGSNYEGPKLGRAEVNANETT